MRMKRRGDCHDDKKRNDIRESHADERVHADALQFRTGRTRGDAERLVVPALEFLDFL